MAAVSDDRAAQIADVLGLSETETRRGLRRWVPDNVNEAHESDPLHGDYPAELTEHERSLWDRMHPMDADARMRVIHYVRYEMSHQRGRQSA